MRNANRSSGKVSAVGSRRDGYGLTRAEKKVLHLIAKGVKRKEIALRLNVSVHTVKTHIESAYRKLEVHSGAAAVEKIIREQVLRYSGEEPLPPPPIIPNEKSAFWLIARCEGGR